MITQRTLSALQLTEVAHWVKSSYSSGSGNNCVEVANLVSTPYAAVAVRDSKTPAGPALLVSPAAFAAFVAHVRA